MSSRNLKCLKARDSGSSLSDNNSMQEFSESGVCKSLLKSERSISIRFGKRLVRMKIFFQVSWARSTCTHLSRLRVPANEGKIGARTSRDT